MQRLSRGVCRGFSAAQTSGRPCSGPKTPARAEEAAAEAAAEASREPPKRADGRQLNEELREGDLEPWSAGQHKKIWRAMGVVMVVGVAAFTMVKMDLLESRREDVRRKDQLQEKIMEEKRQKLLREIGMESRDYPPPVTQPLPK